MAIQREIAWISPSIAEEQANADDTCVYRKRMCCKNATIFMVRQLELWGEKVHKDCILMI